MPLPRTPVDELIEDLRDEAVDIARALDDIPAHETTGGQAAQTLEEYHDALTRIAEGADDPRAVAEAVLSLGAPLKRIGDPDDTIRGLLKPRPI